MLRLPLSRWRHGASVLRTPARPSILRLKSPRIQPSTTFSNVPIRGSSSRAHIHESLRLFWPVSHRRRETLETRIRRRRGVARAVMALINPEIARSRRYVEDCEAVGASRHSRQGAGARRSWCGLRSRGKLMGRRASNFTASVIHRTYHLHGVCFFDRMKTFETLTFLDEFGRYWSERGAAAVKEE